MPPLIFVICMIPLSLLLRKVKASCEYFAFEKNLNLIIFSSRMTSSSMAEATYKQIVWYKQCLRVVKT